MSNEDIMSPRYKVIALYPGCWWKVNDIFYYSDHNCFKTESQPSIPMHGSIFTEHPHLFKKLEWWEEREIDEMPEYVKIQRFYEHIPCAVYKVGAEVEWNYSDDCLIGIKFITGGGTMPNYALPATLAEYEAFINKKEKP